MTKLPIRLSSGFSPLVKEGQTVKQGDKLAKRLIRTDVSYDLAKNLGVPIRKLGKFLKKNPGDRVIPGDVIAEKKKLLRTDRIISEITGTMLRFERDSGMIVVKLEEDMDDTMSDADREITEEGTIEYILCPLDGTITLCNNEQIQIQTDKNVLVGIEGTGTGAEGELILVGDRETDEVSPHTVTTDAIGKVILGGKFSREVLMKAISIGVIGIIGTDIAEEDFTYLVGKDIRNPVMTVSKDVGVKLTKHIGKKIYLEGKTKTILLLNYENKHT